MMETEYITKFEALEAVGAASCDISCYDYEKIEKAIQDITVADVRSVVRGRWGLDPQCPICGEDRYKGLDADIWAAWEPPFCPNCGADMRVVSNNSN